MLSRIHILIMLLLILSIVAVIGCENRKTTKLFINLGSLPSLRETRMCPRPVLKITPYSSEWQRNLQPDITYECDRIQWHSYLR